MINIMISKITVKIEILPIKNKFNNSYNIYLQLKKLLHPKGETQFL